MVNVQHCAEVVGYFIKQHTKKISTWLQKKKIFHHFPQLCEILTQFFTWRLRLGTDNIVYSSDHRDTKVTHYTSNMLLPTLWNTTVRKLVQIWNKCLVWRLILTKFNKDKAFDWLTSHNEYLNVSTGPNTGMDTTAPLATALLPVITSCCILAHTSIRHWLK